ncbi:hypothetical protein KGF54_002253 [Candida jiufengensis]|uniref:uncharacterized protein n=1 Tax=Candida jiufengensis TaxID=497108 RepID=UPI0022259EC3|nr:uncharacterized protein KGF54_002253 [Candida jiufengensis]KAI5954478.1 hypothetical protein KGF54_002253 [Candida jiufengensis]
MFSRTLLKGKITNFSIFIRQNSQTAQTYIRQKPKLYSLLKTKTTKSLILTLFTTSIIIDLIKIRKNLINLETSYSLKFEILENIITQLKNSSYDDNFDLKKELKLANSFIDNKQQNKQDLEIDFKLNEFLKSLEEEDELNVKDKELIKDKSIDKSAKFL